MNEECQQLIPTCCCDDVLEALSPSPALPPLSPITDLALGGDCFSFLCCCRNNHYTTTRCITNHAGTRAQSQTTVAP